MSVLTILGNGLDLAHGLKTKFDDFMKAWGTSNYLMYVIHYKD